MLSANQDLLEYISSPPEPGNPLSEDPFQESLTLSTSKTEECDDIKSFPQKLKNMSYEDYSTKNRNDFLFNRKEYLRLALLCHPDKTNGSIYPMQVLGAIKNNDDIPKPIIGGKRRRKSKNYGKTIRKSTRRRR